MMLQVRQTNKENNLSYRKFKLINIAIYNEQLYFNFRIKVNIRTIISDYIFLYEERIK